VTEIDLARKRIALSMRSKPELGARPGNTATGKPVTGPGQLRSGNGPRPAPAAPAAPQSLNGDWFTAALNKKK